MAITPGNQEQPLIKSSTESTSPRGSLVRASTPPNHNAPLVSSLASQQPRAVIEALAAEDTSGKEVSLRILDEGKLPPGVAYQEIATNESVAGIVERGRWTKNNIHPTDFWGIGHPTKVALQAGLMQPKDRIGLIDISSQNTFDAMMLFHALQKGHPTIASYLQTPEGAAFYQKTVSAFPASVDGQSFDTNTEHLIGEGMYSVDGALKYLVATTGVSLQEIMHAFRGAKDISVIWGSAKNISAIADIASGKQVVLDASHVPLGLDLVDDTGKQSVRSELSRPNVSVAYALHSTDNTLATLGVGTTGAFDVPVSQGIQGTNKVWRYSPTTPGGGIMPVGIASGTRYVNQIAPVADNKHGLY